MWLVCEAVHDGRVIMCAGSKRPSMPNAQAVMAVDGYHDATEILVSVVRLHPPCLQCLQLRAPAPCFGSVLWPQYRSRDCLSEYSPLIQTAQTWISKLTIHSNIKLVSAIKVMRVWNFIVVSPIYCNYYDMSEVSYLHVIYAQGLGHNGIFYNLMLCFQMT